MKTFWCMVFGANAGLAIGMAIRMAFSDYVPSELQIALNCIAAAGFWMWMLIAEATRGSNSI